MNFFTILCESKTYKMDTFSISLFPFEQRKNGKINNNNYNKRILRGNISRQAEVIKQTTKTTKITDLLNVRLDEM